MGLDFSCGERAEVGGRDLEKGNPDTLVGLLSNCVCTMCLYWALLHTTVAAVESISTTTAASTMWFSRESIKVKDSLNVVAFIWKAQPGI